MYFIAFHAGMSESLDLYWRKGYRKDSLNPRIPSPLTFLSNLCLPECFPIPHCHFSSTSLSSLAQPISISLPLQLPVPFSTSQAPLPKPFPLHHPSLVQVLYHLHSCWAAFPPTLPGHQLGDHWRQREDSFPTFSSSARTWTWHGPRQLGGAIARKILLSPCISGLEHAQCRSRF